MAMASTIRPRTLLLPALLFATLGGCAVYDPRPVVTGSSYVDPRMQDEQIVEDRQARMAIAREWKEQEERARIRRVQRNAS